MGEVTLRGPRTPLGRVARRARRPLMRAFGVTPESRTALVTQMLDRQAHEAPMYWLQILLAMSIATLGLALGSSAVVLGAMLISPLMTPIVELGMGLAVGSPVLVARAFTRVAMSVVVVIGCATAITLALPFHEVTAPIAARTSPTALDLLIASCCALMACFTTLGGRSNPTVTAAGTAVAIALVPPLCVVGFGLGTRQLALARGAALLFVASFSAIMLFSIVTFAAFGFGEIDSAQLERTALQTAASEGSSAAVETLRRLFGGRSGGLLRIVLPLLLLAVVYVPLRSALEEVAWEVRARQAIRRELDALASATVRSSVDVAQHRVGLKLVIVGDHVRAEALERELALRISAATGVVPTVGVLAVPDAEAMHEALQTVTLPRPEPIQPPALGTTTARLEATLTRMWPTESVGGLVGWRLDVDSTGEARAEVAHFGDRLGPAGEQMLAGTLSDAVQQPIRVVDVALPQEPLSAPTEDAAAWFTEIAPWLDNVARFPTLFACVGVPALSPLPRDAGIDAMQQPADAGLDELRVAVVAAAARVPDGRARVVDDSAWTLRVQATACTLVTEPSVEGPSDAGESVDGRGLDGSHN